MFVIFWDSDIMNFLFNHSNKRTVRWHSAMLPSTNCTGLVSKRLVAAAGQWPYAYSRVHETAALGQQRAPVGMATLQSWAKSDRKHSGAREAAVVPKLNHRRWRNEARVHKNVGTLWRTISKFTSWVCQLESTVCTDRQGLRRQKWLLSTVSL